MSWRLYCPSCGFRGEEQSYFPFCPACRGPLEVEGVLPEARRELGEGRTPVVFEGDVAFKLEHLNPSGSFKDRGISYSLQIAKRLGYRCTVIDSSGNAAISAALYARRLKLEAIVVVPRNAHRAKLSLISSLGAKLLTVENRDRAHEVAVSFSKECFYISHPTSPLFLEGMKGLGEELSEMSRRLTVIAPVSSGSLLLGAYRGLRGRGVEVKLIAAQAAEKASLSSYVSKAYSVGGESSRLADALVIGKPPRAAELAKAIVEGGGAVVKVGDESIKESLGELLDMGFLVEPSSAVAWSAYKVLREELKGEQVAIVLTGSGLKYLEGLRS
ncbi:MAG: pyridoxal-phosphate dependent enzyme [Acidilobaceae archaeon]|nr:pyridoxal-phosphate dependent enzyme [Acidilobaceae archaeon]MCX8165579.1 pyridoxal-phosphate dependent enzyme [Acidilobaceae archaeon]MDW7974006.1 pyridoxal-phosphate dependent enzyme [Sulfolobales archaeon]